MYMTLASPSVAGIRQISQNQTDQSESSWVRLVFTIIQCYINDTLNDQYKMKKK